MKWLTLTLALGATGCGKDVCDRISPCPKDPVQTGADRSACKKTEQAASGSLCFNETISYAGCFNDNLVCGADGTADTRATTTRATAICSTQLAAFNNCCNNNPAAVACN